LTFGYTAQYLRPACVDHRVTRCLQHSTKRAGAQAMIKGYE
jgi:hypothetical protein